MPTLTMFRRPLLVLAISAAVLACAPQAEAQVVDQVMQPDQPGGFATDRVILQLQPGVAATTLPSGRAALRPAAVKAGAKAAVASKSITETDRLITRWNVASIKPAISQPPANAALAAQLGLDRYVKVAVPRGTDTRRMIQEFARVKDMIQSAELDGVGGIASVTPNDITYPNQWSLHNTGQTIAGQTGFAGADIKAPEAWTITTGSEDIILAVIDSGIDPHEDIAAKLLPGHYVIDMDSNTADECNHGTHVAGTAAALGNNGLGMAGVAWGPRVLPVRVLASCNGFESDVADGVMWAADHGADVANMSLQFTVGSTVFHNAIIYARQQGVILIAAAGNIPIIGVTYPGRWPETIAVAATDNQDQPYQFGSAGPQVDLAAPGVNINSLLELDSFNFQSGSSMATAAVSGVACLMLSLDPALTHNDIQVMLQQSADDVAAEGFDEQTGHGRLNAEAALQLVLKGLPGGPDIDANGVVNGIDLGILLSQWGTDGPADLDRNGVVNGIDLGILLAAWTL